MTDQMETRKRKLIDIRHIDFILDDDDDVGGDNCNDVAHIEQEIFWSNSCANCGTFVYIPCIIAQYYRPSTYDSFYICLHLNWNSGDALRQKSRFTFNLSLPLYLLQLNIENELNDVALPFDGDLTSMRKLKYIQKG